MSATRYRLFKIPDGGNLIVFVPELGRVYRVSRETGDTLPDFVSVNETVPASRVKDTENSYPFESVVLVLTNRCNLQCLYCYGDFGMPKKGGTGRIMELHVAKAAIDFVLQQVFLAHKKKIHLGLFGGEPTLAWHRMLEAIKCMKTAATSNGIAGVTSITTNGAISLSRASWLAENIDSISISFDGFKSIQDLQRSNSFDKVFAATKRMYELSPKKLSLRATVTGYSVEFLPQIVEFFGEHFPGCVQKYEPLFPMGRGLTAEGSRALPYPLFFEKFLQSIPIAKRYHARLKTSVLRLRTGSDTTFCGASGKNFLVTHDGRIVVCNRMVEDSANGASDFFCIGFFNERSGIFLIDKKKYKKLGILSLKSIPECQDCFARFSCKGDCPANKAVVSPSTFWHEKSYRCEDVRVFIKNVLSYILDNGMEGLFL